MRILRIGFASLIAFSVLTLSQLALADISTDSCADVLSGGVFDKQEIDESQYNRSILYSRVKQTSWEQAQNSTKFGANIADLFSGSASRDEYEALRRALEVTNFSDVESQYIGSYRLMVANKDILKEWSACMQQRGGGLQVWFTPVSTTIAELHIRYIPALSVQAPTTVKSEAKAEIIGSPKKITDPKGCLKKGHKFDLGDCTVTLEFNSHEDIAHVTIYSPLGDKTSYLPPRVGYQLKAGQPYPDNLIAQFTYEFDWHGGYWKANEKILHLDDSLIKDGWVFDPKHTVASAATRTSGSGECQTSSFQKIQPYDVYTTQELKAADAKATVTCRYAIVPRLQKIERIGALNSDSGTRPDGLVAGSIVGNL